MRIDTAEMMNLRADAKTLKDVADLFAREGSFTVLPSVLTNMADDILKVVNSEGDKQ